MFHIYIKGTFTDESQLIQGKTLPKSAVPFREGETIHDAFQLGFLLSLPVMLPMVGLSIFRCSELDKKLQFNSHMAAAVLVFFVLLKVLTYLHEFIHALFYPVEAEKTVWKDAKQGAYFIYCDVPVTKCHFIMLSIAPSILLGIVPFIAWYQLAPLFHVEWLLCFMALTWIMTLMSIGDFANVFHAITQVPANAKVLNYGLHSYWIKERYNSDEL